MINIKGKKFGKLTPIKYIFQYWLCRCDCGRTKKIRGDHLRYGKIVSCGCYRPQETHGFSKHELFDVWRNMIDRCENPQADSFKHYGNRGIKVCERWHDIANFITDMSSRPKGFQIDRIDNERNYCRENCQWISPKENSRKRANTIFLTQGKETHCIAEWAEILNCSKCILLKRFHKGWSHKDILTTPIKK